MFIDVVFFICMALAVYKGYSRGLIVALFSVVGFVIGLAAAIKLSVVVAVYINKNINIASQWLPVLSFSLIFIIFVFLVRLGAGLIERTMRMVMLGWANKLGGIILYAALYTIILGVVFYYANKMGFIKPKTIANSTVCNMLGGLGPWAIDSLCKVVPVFKGMFGQLEIFFDGVAHKAA